MDDILSFVIPIEPVPASRAKGVAGRPGYYPKRYDNWRKEAALILARLMGELPTMGDSPVEVWLEFVCPRPKKPSKPYPRGDGDNYEKAVLDALTKAGLWDDDVQVVSAHKIKRYATKGEAPCIRVKVAPLEFE